MSSLASEILLDRPIVMVGLMGAGKTSVGRALARRLGIPFVDSDKEIEAAAGCSVVDIFAMYGEQEFRRVEQRVIARLLDSPPALKVISTGEGAFITPAVREMALKKALTVWLKADLELLVKRTNFRDTRPQLLNADSRKILAQLIDERYRTYDMAVGIIVGSVMTSVVNSLVKDVIMPPIGLLIGGVDFSQWFIVLKGGVTGVHYPTVAAAQAAGATTLNIGLFLNSVVSFLITMFAIFLFVRMMNKIRTQKPVTTRTCPYCKTSINVAATKCPNCCSNVKPVEVAAASDSDLEKSVKKLTKMAKGKISKIKKITKN